MKFDIYNYLSIQTLSDEERNLIEYYRNASAIERARVIWMINLLLYTSTALHSGM